MSRALVGLMVSVGVFAPAIALAQVDGGVAPSPASVGTTSDADALRKDFDAKLDAARREVKELREEMRAQMATQSAAQGWQEDWTDEKRKLELLSLDGYFRVRPDLFYKFDLGRGLDPAGYSLWPRSPTSDVERTNAGVNMRFRLEPTINVTEEVRIRAQIDALDNIIWGSTPDYAFSRNGFNGYAYDTNEFSIFGMSQVPPSAGLNSLQDSIRLKRVWAEVGTPIGILRFGRMGSHWGLGMLHNDGNGVDSDFGDTVDRVSFTAEPLPGFFVAPMIDVNLSGISSVRQQSGGQPVDLSNSDGVISYIITLARRDTPQQRLAKLDAGDLVFNYGLHFTYRTQRNDAVEVLSQPYTTDGQNPISQTHQYVQRQGNIFMPDLWAKLEQKNWRLEAEAAALLGSIQNRALTYAAGDTNTPQSLYMYQFGAVMQGEYRLLNGDLEIGADLGFASGDKSPGFGNYPRRSTNTTRPAESGSLYDGPQYSCPNTCTDNEINNFRFNRDFRVDMILYRELLGGITDSFYIKPRAKYRITHGFEAFAALIYSRAIFAESTPAGAFGNGDPNLGVEINAGAKYETEDGFFGQVQYGILFPLGGFRKETVANSGQAIPLDNAQALRAVIGVKF